MSLLRHFGISLRLHTRLHPRIHDVSGQRDAAGQIAADRLPVFQRTDRICGRVARCPISSFVTAGLRSGFTIRLKRLKPRAPDFGGPQNFGSKKNFQHFLSNYICIFVLVQRTPSYYAAIERSL